MKLNRFFFKPLLRGAFFILGFCFFLEISAWACLFSGDSKLFFYSSYQHGQYSHRFQKSVLSNCPKKFPQYLILVRGIHLPTPFFQNNVFLKPEKFSYACHLKPRPFSKVPISFFRKLLKENFRLFRTCFQYRITDQSPRGLLLPKKQPAGCTFKRISPHTVLVQDGRYCVFQIQPSSQWTIRYELTAACKDPSFLKKQSFSPQDLFFSFDYFYSNLPHMHPQVHFIKSVLGRWVLSPPKGLFPISLSFENHPSFPKVLAFQPDLGKILVYPGEDPLHWQMQAHLSVRHICARKCKKGMCAKPCAFSLPLGMTFRLYESISSHKTRLLDQWNAAEIIPAQWQGLVPLSPHGLSFPIRISDPAWFQKKFLLKVTFQNPTGIYLSLKDQTQVLPNWPSFQAPGAFAQMPEIPEIRPIDQKKNSKTPVLIPSLPEVPNLPFLKEMRKIWNHRWSLWKNLLPNIHIPYIEKFCAPSLKHCTHAIYQNRPPIELSLWFRFKKNPETGLAIQPMKRERFYFWKRKKEVLKNPSLPDIVCE